MSSGNNDPKRLLDILADEGRSDDLGRMLAAGKSEVPNDAQVMALAAKIGILGGLGGIGGAGIAGAGGGGAAGAGGGAGAGAGAAKVAVGVTAAKAGIAIKIGGVVVVASAVGAGAVVATKTDVVTPHRAPMGIVATVSSSTNIVVVAPHSPSAGGTSILPALDPTNDVPSANVAPARPSAKASAEGAEVEVRLLERAQDALRSRPAEALALADDHARRFPHGMLVQEREVIAIEALVKLNRTADAKARAARFKARFPGSSHTRRIDALVGE